MTRRVSLVVFLVALLVGAAGQGLQAQNDADAGRRVPADLVARAQADGRVRVIVHHTGFIRPEPDLPTASDVTFQRAQMASTGDLILASLAPGSAARVRRLATLPYFAVDVDMAALGALERSPFVIEVQADRLLEPELIDSVPLVGAPDAWSDGFTGFGWTVAVLDTGVDSAHGFLAGKVTSEACFSTTSAADGATSLCPGGLSSSVAPGSGAPCPSQVFGCDHGTHVAGIATGTGSSFSGVARDADVLAIQVFSRFDSPSLCGSLPTPCALAYSSDVMMALEHVYALSGSLDISSANLSLGGGFFTAPCDADPLKPAVDQLRAAGIATVVSAGNSGAPAALSTPACISSAVSVGSTTKTDAISSFSNRAAFLSLLAPGSSIYSSVPGGGFSLKSGTSMAAPHVAGAWAILKQRKPSASVDELLAALQATGQPVFDFANGMTFARIRVHDALGSLLGPQMSLDIPTGGTLAQPFLLAGWAIDQAALIGTGVDAVHVWAYPNPGSADPPIFVGAASYGDARPDVGTVFGAQFTNSAFGLIVSGLPPGSYQFIAYAHSSVDSAFTNERTVTATVLASPHMAIETPADGAAVPPTFTIAGWALDLAAGGGTGVDAVDVWAYPNPGSGMAPMFLGGAAYGGARPDVGATFGAQFTNSAYSLTVSGLATGAWQIVAFMHSTVTGTFIDALSVTVTVGPDPRMSVDLPNGGAAIGQPFIIAGWAIDRAATFGTGVDTLHVWAYPVGGGPPQFLGATAYGGARPDVGAVYGAQFTNSGFSLTATGLSPGAYNLVVYAHSTVTGTFNDARVVPVSIW